MASTMGSIAITTALTGTENAAISTVITGIGRSNGVSLVATFTYVSGGTTAKVYVQTSFDSGTTWLDIKQFAFTTASAIKGANVSNGYGVTSAAMLTATMADDDIQQGLIGDRLRYIVKSTGTYGAGTSVRVDHQVN